ncbi:glycosyltransferase family 2 protein [Granulicella mallensis]|uniref:Glycosyltransferase involved in cell wall biosynthesis n=1 Tax=Granulicella mallensis TaxID=940614 RepID=A0A7W7ZPD9_9BACT|nr:glycosyltransferase family 2 protein [Granulicella mallensis]MBB5063623.1 glycosyltransferase involved in cell wall biosynthesis [Granulicella mallensis]
MSQTQPALSDQVLRISVAMCTYNGERYLNEQLQSFVDQHRLPDELILCDDGSIDNTLSLAEEFARHAPFPVRIVRNAENLGYSRNFAKAISLCSGEVIALSDQDDLWYPQKLARLRELFSAHPEAEGIFSNGDLIDRESHKLPGDLWASFRFRDVDQKRLRSGHAVDVLLQRNVVTGMAFAFRRTWKDELRLMPASWPHDAWLALLMAQAGKLLACPEHLVAYRVHENQKIGVPITSAQKRSYILQHGLGGYLALSRKRNQKDYRASAELFEDLLRVATADSSEDLQRKLLQIRGQIQAKVDHARTSAALLDLSRLRRWPHVLRRKKHYERHSPTGVQAMIRDLLL